VNGRRHQLDAALEQLGSAEEYKVGVSGRLRDKVLRPTAIIFASVPNATLSPFVTNHS